MSNIDIIIATYNRPTKVLELVMQLLPIHKNLGSIIVVDSSESSNASLKSCPGVLYLRSSHKNQPYQRYLGYLISNSDLLVFLDDDMEIVDADFLSKLKSIFKEHPVSGVAMRFENKHEDTPLAKMPVSVLFKNSPALKRMKGWLSGCPQLKEGEFGLCGNKGKQPLGGGKTEYVYGPAFAAQRAAMFNNFNFQLFDIFEKHLGMGEDGIIGYGIAKQGQLIYHDELFFLHNDQKNSVYTVDTFAFARRVAFSRFYLSMERSRLNHRSLGIVGLHYHYYQLWRVAGLVLNLLLNPNRERWLILKGNLEGWRETLSFSFSFSDRTKTFWENQAKRDVENAGLLCPKEIGLSSGFTRSKR